MNKADVNRRVLAIQAKKKRHKNRKRGKQNGTNPQEQSNSSQNQNPKPSSNPIPEPNRSSENLQAPDNANNSHLNAPSSAAFSKATATATASTSSGGSAGTPDQYQPPKKTQAKAKPNTQKEHQQQPPRSSSNESYESETFSDNEDQELMEDYCKGGYHPVNIGDLFHGKSPVSNPHILAFSDPKNHQPLPRSSNNNRLPKTSTAQINRTHSGWFFRPLSPFGQGLFFWREIGLLVLWRRQQ